MKTLDKTDKPFVRFCPGLDFYFYDRRTSCVDLHLSVKVSDLVLCGYAVNNEGVYDFFFLRINYACMHRFRCILHNQISKIH